MPSERSDGPLSNAFEWYKLQLAKTPVATKGWTAAIVGAIGELVAQAIAGRSIRISRNTFAFFGTGLIYTGPFFHWWHQVLGQLVPDGSKFPIVQKLLWDRLVCSPPYLYLNFVLLAMLNGKSFTAARTNAGKIVGTAFASGLKFWTVINGLIFAFVPVQFRVLWGNFAAVGWGAYMSALANSAGK
eukprot:gene12767-7623_t